VRGYWQQKIGSLLGLFTILLVVFAPLVSQTLRANDPAALALSSLCIASESPFEHQGPDHQPAHGLDDQACAYCGLALHVPILPSVSFAVRLLPAPIAFALPERVAALLPFRPVSSAQPRGPPLSA
jgi:hypothetical protein